MTMLFIITRLRKTNHIMFGENSFQMDLAEPDEKPYQTYMEAEEKIPSLGKGIFQVQQIFINEK